MADNDTVDNGALTDYTARDKDRAGVKTQIVALDLNPNGASEVLQSATALADATANPTIPSVAALGLLFNGTTWDRIRGDTTNGVDVDVTRLPALPAGTNNIGDVDIVSHPSHATATLANVSASVTSVTLQASNTARKGWVCWNDSTSVVYVKFGSTASTTSCTFKMFPDDLYEMSWPHYNGIITGIWVAAAGSARVTEIT